MSAVVEWRYAFMIPRIVAVLKVRFSGRIKSANGLENWKLINFFFLQLFHHLPRCSFSILKWKKKKKKIEKICNRFLIRYYLFFS